ncbi:Protein UNUSUAL FLORAL ORGANS [Platanthera guangdongensis]|uniref:Protein UNUSUAL FLORAL ORGANS n=1 Tax=Platanthera guangdongensis TaxID=2320717 RepID=A0ABR2N4Y2_9ASPA
MEVVVRLIREKLRIAQERYEKYTNRRRSELEFATQDLWVPSRFLRELVQPLTKQVLDFFPLSNLFYLVVFSRRYYFLGYASRFCLSVRQMLSDAARMCFGYLQHELEDTYQVRKRLRIRLTQRFFSAEFEQKRYSQECMGGDIGCSVFSTAVPLLPAFILDPTTSTWLRLPLASFLPPGFSAAAADAGIICFISDAPGPKRVLLCNPLSKLVAHLPPTPLPRLYPSVGFTAGPSSLSLILAGDDLISPFAVKNLTAECFHADGATGFYSPWSTVSQLPRLCNPDPARLVFSAGTFYCMSSSPFAVLAYDVAGNVWSKIQAPMRRFLRSPSLAVRGSSAVLIIAAVEKSKLSVPRSVRVWSLQPCAKAWAEVERMPPEIYRQFSEAEGGRGFEAVGHGDILAVTIKGSTDVLLFDFGRKEWRWAPPFPFSSTTSGELRGFAYEPRLATPAVGLIDSSSLSFQ